MATSGGDVPGSRRPSRRALTLGAVGLAVVTGVGVVALEYGDQGDPTSAAEGEEGSRTFDGVPAELPRAIVPDAAEAVEGTVARSGEDWSASARFTLEGDHEELARSADAAMLEDGYTMRQRAYDDDTMQVIYDGEDGSVVTVTYERGDPVRVAAIRVSP